VLSLINQVEEEGGISSQSCVVVGNGKLVSCSRCCRCGSARGLGILKAPSGRQVGGETRK
jgi:hypothetical protein